MRSAPPTASPPPGSESAVFAGEWVVDPEARRVSVKGRAKFTWVEGEGKGNWWNEQFAYILDFDDEGKVTDYQVWADSGAAYLARTGQLNTLRDVRRLAHFLRSFHSPWYGIGIRSTEIITRSPIHQCITAKLHGQMIIVFYLLFWSCIHASSRTTNPAELTSEDLSASLDTDQGRSLLSILGL